MAAWTFRLRALTAAAASFVAGKPAAATESLTPRVFASARKDMRRKAAPIIAWTAMSTCVWVASFESPQAMALNPKSAEAVFHSRKSSAARGTLLSK
eukprot:13336333-Alexandrium_andersonii.AAC.1